ncbi:MAG: phosphate signaling complex protein PhoU [Alphaproteobacteria bacterium]|nr:phosphate signaling complex protein PhoU [Alphaproteobacteria bacterium]
MEQTHSHKQYGADLQQLGRKFSHLGEEVKQQIKDALQGVLDNDLELLQKVRDKEKDIDAQQHDINDSTVQVIALHQPVGTDLRYLLMVRDAANELERLGDYAKNIAKWYQKASSEGRFAGYSHLKHIIDYVFNMVSQIVALYQSDLSDDAIAEQAVEIIKADDALDDMYVSLFRESLTYTLEDPKKISGFIHYMLIIKHIERMGDVVTNIAELLYYRHKGVFPDFESE